MAEPLRLLIVEDSADDAWVVERNLRGAGYEVDSLRVETAAQLAEALSSGDGWDVILADYNLPGFSGLDAVRIVREHDADVPLVLVSGAIELSTALEALKAGARDFVFKHDLGRLPSVIERELGEARDREEKRRAERERDDAIKELTQSNDRLSAFVGLTDVPLRDMSVTGVVTALLERVVAAVGADGAVIHEFHSGELMTLGAVGPGAAHPSDLPFVHDLVHVALDDSPVFIAKPPDGASVQPKPDGPCIHSVLGVPMHYDGKVVGILRTDWCTPHDPTNAERALLTMAANRCAMAIENSRLYEREHRAAETLQLALMSVPAELCGIRVGHFYCSATHETLVGGDFFDVFEVKPGKVALAVGDVSGKGLEAAAVTALVRNAVRAHAIDGESPSATLTKTNNLLERFTSVETFVTAFFGVLDVDTGELTYTGAGHLPPIIAGPNGARALTENGPFLGAFADVEYGQSVTTLTPQETLVLFTDGLTEARDPEGRFFGEERVFSLLADGDGDAIAVASRLRDAVGEFSGGRLRDDVAVLVVQLTPGECPGPSPALGCA